MVIYLALFLILKVPAIAFAVALKEMRFLEHAFQMRRRHTSNTSNNERKENPTYMPMKPPREENSFAVVQAFC